MIEDFFVVDLDDMEVILNIQWMQTLNEYTQSFKRQSGWKDGSPEGNVKWRAEGNLDTTDGSYFST